MAKSWCKVSASLDTHPRVRRAGNLGRQVFEFALRRNAELDKNGAIPAEHLEADYLADLLMMSESDAASGLSACVRTRLLAVDGDHYVICGWDDDWGKTPMTEAERKRVSRAKSRKDSDVTIVTNVSGQDRDCPDSHALEESRSEEIRSEGESAPAPHPAATEAPAPAANPDPSRPVSQWSKRKVWWDEMLAADQRIRAAGIEPNASPLPPAPAGENERNLAACERQLADAGYSAASVDAKMRHVVAVAETEAMRERHRRWFKPALIWDPKRAARAADTPLEEAARKRDGPRARSPHVGRVEPARPEDYGHGDQEL